MIIVSFWIGYVLLRVSHRDRSLARCSFLYLSVPFSKLTEGLANIAHDVNVISEYAGQMDLASIWINLKSLFSEVTHIRAK